jgi:hypothetical protein
MLRGVCLCHKVVYMLIEVYTMTLGISMLRKIPSCMLNCKHVTLAISMFNYIFPLHT